MIFKVNDNGALRQFNVAQMSDLQTKMPNVTFGTKTTLVDTTTLSFSKDGDNDWYCTAENPIQGFTKTDFVHDAIYTVTWDGIEYSGLFVQLHENNTYDSETNKVTGWYDWCCIGNASILGYHNYYETDAPFCVAYDFHRNEAEIQIFTLSTEASHTIKIEKTSYTKTLTPTQYYTDTYKGRSPISWGKGELSIVEGGGTKADGDASHSEGVATIANGVASHSEGVATIADANYSHAEGYITIASGNASHSEGYGAESTGSESHAEGIYSIASGNFGSHAEGNRTEASGSYGSHSEGYYTVASGNMSHAEGGYTTASGIYSHAQNANTTASGITSSASGNNTIANHRSQYVFGEYNVIDTSEAESSQKGNYIEIVGNGTRDSRSNARTLDWSGNEVLAGKLTVGASPTNNMDVATKGYVDNLIPSVPVTDVKINGSSIVSGGEAVIPLGSHNNYGVVKPGNGLGLAFTTSGALAIAKSNTNQIKSGASDYAVIVPANQHTSVFYGLAKLAGADMASSDNAVGTYTDAAKTAIKTMIGVPDTTYDLNLGNSITTNADLNTYTTPGIYNADSTVISSITNAPTTTTPYKLIVESTGTNTIRQTVKTIYGDTYIRVGDSSTSSWEFIGWKKNITNVDYATSSNAGVVKVDSTNGIGIESGHKLYIEYAPSNLIKSGTGNYRPITPPRQHEATFYGLAKAAGDSTQSASSNAVGTYTSEAKAAIKTMIGVPTMAEIITAVHASYAPAEEVSF